MVHSNDIITTDYLDGFQYHNDKLKHFTHAEGYVNIVDIVENKFKYVFNYMDHLGNVRLSYSDANENNVVEEDEILEENHYYPFGLKHTAYNTNHRQYVSNEELNEIILAQMPKFTGDGSYNYKYNGKEYQDELGLNMYDYGARNYDPALGRWMNIDPLAETSRRWTPYNYAYNNPMYFVDPDGMRAFDWIKNMNSGKIEWKSEVTSPSNTPSGYSYVGKEDSSIITNLFGTTGASENSRDIGVISAEDFDNPYSAKGYGLNNVMTNTTLSVSLTPDVSTVYNSDGSVQSKEFKGVNIGASVSGDVVAPYQGMDMKLMGDSMTLQGNEMKTHETAPNGEIRQGGDVPTLTYDSYWNSSSIQSNFGKSYNLDFNFEGQYMNGNSPLGIMSPLGLFISNSTNVNVKIPFNNN